ncbi:MAG TPA: fumarylacetoacetase [Solirubrobacteraceae bacterium]|nr:fumarylacetoacetase [Solirubrobacteraceae bacterium]
MAEASWVPEGTPGFGPANLPYGAVAPPGGAARVAVRIGDHALLLEPLATAGLLDDVPVPRAALASPVLNGLMACVPEAWAALRARLQELLADPDDRAGAAGALVALADLDVRMPVAIGDYVDFYSSLEHATNVGRLFRPDGDPLPPNWRHLPIGYHGRAGTVVVSGTAVRRPCGQLGPGEFGATRALDLELELGVLSGGPGSSLGVPIPIEEAARHAFGFVLVNDWSARDIQRWEYQPLGPFLAKSFATSISPWVVPLAALEPFRVPGPTQDPEPLPYLRTSEDWALDVALEVEVAGEVVSRANARGLYWNVAQQLAHATVNGAVVRPGDLFASGTISGPEPGTEGSLLELGRGFLADGDEVVLRGWCGEREVSFGEVAGRILPAGSQ